MDFHPPKFHSLALIYVSNELAKKTGAICAADPLYGKKYCLSFLLIMGLYLLFIDYYVYRSKLDHETS